MKLGAVSLSVFLVLPSALAQLTAGKFTPTGNLNTSRFAHTATLLADGRVLIAGGCIDESGFNAAPPFCGSTITATAEIYNPATGTFTPTGNMTAARAYHTATLLPDGRVLFAAGLGEVRRPSPDLEGPDYALTSAELYDPASGTFAATGNMKNRSIAGANTATLLPDGHVLITGSDAELYDPALGSFTITGNDTAHPFAIATLLPDGTVLGTSWGYLFSSELYDPRTGAFRPTGKGAEPLGTRGVLLSNGTVLTAGGNDDPGPSSLASLYDPAIETFSRAGNMITPRADHTATLLGNGKVLIAGGSTWQDVKLPDGNVAMYHVCCALNAELYDSATGAFSNTGSMAAARKGHTATLLNNGDVLIAGGSGGGYPGSLATAEIYHPEPVNPQTGN
jgi:Galactose oxidase, central domain